MSKPRLLVTGASGLIGGILLPHLATHFDIFGADLAPAPADTFIRRADVANEEQLRDVFEEFAPVSRVLHLAANSHHEADWQAVLTANIHGTWNVFRLAAESNVQRVVFASSNHATGYYEGLPPTLHRQDNPPTIRPNDPVRPDGPYGISKIAGEAIARYFYDARRVEAVCLRIGSVTLDDDPTTEDRLRSTWLSHRDLKHLAERALLAQPFRGFGIYYGVSNNARRFWDVTNAEVDLQYHPVDDASRPTTRSPGRLAEDAPIA